MVSTTAAHSTDPSQEVAKHVKGGSLGRARRRCCWITTGIPRWVPSAKPQSRAGGQLSKSLLRPQPIGLRGSSSPRRWPTAEDTRERFFRHEHFARAGQRPASTGALRSTPPCGWWNDRSSASTNMTMAWGLEGGCRSSTTSMSNWRHLPARAKTGPPRQRGVLKGAHARRVSPPMS